MTDELQKPRETADQFARHAKTTQPGHVREMLSFVWRERKWFLAPIIGLLLLAGLFIFLGGSAVAPFIYALF